MLAEKFEQELPYFLALAKRLWEHFGEVRLGGETEALVESLIEESDEEFNDLPDAQKAIVRGRAGAYFDKQVLTEMIEKPLRVARELDLPLYCGEFGVFEKAPAEDRYRWYADMLAILEENDISYANWNYKSDQFGFVGKNGQPIEAMRDALAPAIR